MFDLRIFADDATYDAKSVRASDKSVKTFMFHVVDRNDGHRVGNNSSTNETIPRPDSDRPLYTRIIVTDLTAVNDNNNNNNIRLNYNGFVGTGGHYEVKSRKIGRYYHNRGLHNGTLESSVIAAESVRRRITDNDTCNNLSIRLVITPLITEIWTFIRLLNRDP